MSAAEFTEGPLTLEEQIKILSLFDNPPEAAMVRKALRFYEVPEMHQFSYGDGTNAESARIMHHFANPQAPEELAWMLKHVEGKSSLLEVGSNFGGTLKRMAAVMQKGSRIVSVDLDCDSTPKCLNPLASLKETCRQLSRIGANVELIVGDSHNRSVIDRVRDYGPFDFGFIDGDHSYDGVKADWEAYGPMCKAVGFHDIYCMPDVCRFWQELKHSRKWVTDEIIATEGHKFGIGVVYLDKRVEATWQ